MKNKWFLFLLLVLWYLFLPCSLHAQLYINEVMQSNISTLDFDNDLPDSWVEIFNTSDDTVYLKNYTLQSNDKSYTFSAMLPIPAHGYRLIFCDEKNYGSHTNFKLEFKKESLLKLFDDANQLLDEISIPIQKQVGVSFGRNIEDSSSLGWLTFDTPNASNSPTSELFLQAPTLSHSSGLYDTTIIVRKNELTDSSSITFYTTNGSIPTSKDHIFADSLIIDKTTVLRLRNIKDGAISSPTVSYSYIRMNRDITLPIVSIICDSLYLYNDTIGIYTDGSYSKEIKNYEYDWHRPIHVNFFDKEGRLVLNQSAEVRIAGATSRRHPQKSMILYSKKRYSGNDFLYPFWNEKNDIKQVHSFLLRNAGNDFLYAHLRDAAVQTYAGGLIPNLDYQAYEPVIVFLNKRYVGLMNLRERTNEDYIRSNYPDVGDIDVVENWYYINCGDTTDVLKFYKLFMSENVTYEELSQVMDMDEFMNYLIVETYFGNGDYPDNNIVMWKERKEGAKWRWILKDLDMTLDYRHVRSKEPIFNTVNFFSQWFNLTSESPYWENYSFPTLLMRKLLAMKPFKEQFIDRFSVYMGDFLHPLYTVKHIDSLAQRIEYEFPFTYDEYAEYRKDDWADWYQEVDIMKTAAGKRNWLNPYSMNEFFGLDGMYSILINSLGENQTYQLSFNDIDMLHTTFMGYYFYNRPIHLRTKQTSDSSPIEGWIIEKNIGDIKLTEYRKGDSLDFSLPKGSLVENVTITPSYDKVFEGEESILNTPNYYLVENGILITNVTSKTNIVITDLTGRVYYNKIGSDLSEYIIPLKKGIYLIKINENWSKVYVTK